MKNIFQWKRRVVQDIVVNVAIRSIDVLNKMAKENSDTIFALREALILYDPKNILRSIEKDATLTEPIPVNLKNPQLYILVFRNHPISRYQLLMK
jgi:hypothetical protein